MYRILTLTAVAAALLATPWLRRRFPAGPGGQATASGRYPALGKLAAFGFWLCFIGQVATGAIYVGLLGHSLAGYPILLHVGCGAFMTVCLAAMLLLRGEALGPAAPGQASRFSPVQKASLWILAACTVILVVSVFTAMLHVWGTDMQHMAIRIHEAAAAVAVAAGVLYATAPRQKP
jgi:hypothetical protein